VTQRHRRNTALPLTLVALLAACLMGGCDGEGESKDVEVASTDADEFWGSVPCEDLTTEASCTARGCQFEQLDGLVELSAGTCYWSPAEAGYGICSSGGFGGSAVSCIYQHERSGRMMGQGFCGHISNWTGIASGISGFDFCSPDVVQGAVIDAKDCWCIGEIAEVPWENKEALSKDESQP
jgi:hypothetical protein